MSNAGIQGQNLCIWGEVPEGPERFSKRILSAIFRAIIKSICYNVSGRTTINGSKEAVQDFKKVGEHRARPWSSSSVLQLSDFYYYRGTGRDPAHRAGGVGVTDNCVSRIHG